jgi:putative transposase
MIWKLTTYTRHQLEERCLEAARLLKQRRLSKSLITKRLGVSRAAVSQWVKYLRSGGLHGLHSRKSSGHPAQLTAHQKPPLLRLLKRGALAAGFPTDRWILRRIQQVIKRSTQKNFVMATSNNKFKNATPVDKYELLTSVNLGFARLRHRPDLILSFFHHAGLSVKQLWSN